MSKKPCNCNDTTTAPMPQESLVNEDYARGFSDGLRETYDGSPETYTPNTPMQRLVVTMLGGFLVAFGIVTVRNAWKETT